jgi:hypothetical protein
MEAHKGAFAAAVAPAMEKAVKSSTDKVLAGLKPAVHDAIKASLQDSFKRDLQDAFKASFQGSIIPAFEKSCQNMFSQIHGTFERGQAERVESEQAQFAAVASMQALQKTADALAPKLLALSSAAAAAAAASPGPTPVPGAQPAAPAAEPQVCIWCERGGGMDCV